MWSYTNQFSQIDQMFLHFGDYREHALCLLNFILLPLHTVLYMCAQ